jgi:3-dehydroquinate synthase
MSTWGTHVSGSSEFSIKTSSGGYSVSIGKGNVGARTPREGAVWIVDSNVARLHSGAIPQSAIRQEAVESAKSLESVANLVEQLRDQGSTRQTQLVAVGGGIVQDLATFSASCYMRGISWIYCPTTMLSMVDSCIGGKSSINVGRYKNIAGNFYPPEEVVIDTRFCDTLTDDQVVEGLCEAAKICYADSDDSFNAYLSLAEGGATLPRDGRLVRLIQHSLWTKKRFIEEDEFDQGIRLLLNFGHTFGHAIEGATSYAISHGISVGLGMLAAEHCSMRLGFSEAASPNVNSLTGHVRRLLRFVPDITANLSRMMPADALECFLSDKKHSAETFTLILFDRQGRLQRVKIPRTNAVRTEILSTFKHLCEYANEVQ